MTDFAIKDFDVTQLALKRGRAPKYPWHALEVGQSFGIPPSPDAPMLAGMQAYCYRMSAKTGKTFRAAIAADGTLVVGRTA